MTVEQGVHSRLGEAVHVEAAASAPELFGPLAKSQELIVLSIGGHAMHGSIGEVGSGNVEHFSDVKHVLCQFGLTAGAFLHFHLLGIIVVDEAGGVEDNHAVNPVGVGA